LRFLSPIWHPPRQGEVEVVRKSLDPIGVWIPRSDRGLSPTIPGWNVISQEILPLPHPDPHFSSTISCVFWSLKLSYRQEAKLGWCYQSYINLTAWRVPSVWIFWRQFFRLELGTSHIKIRVVCTVAVMSIGLGGGTIDHWIHQYYITIMVVE